MLTSVGPRSQAKGSHPMTGNLKALALALVAVFALGALAASAASAADKFTPGVSPAVVTGSGSNNEFKIVGVGYSIKCNTAKFAGTVKTGAEEITVFPTYFGTVAE